MVRSCIPAASLNQEVPIVEIRSLGYAIGGSLADLGMFIVEETEKGAKVVKFSGARPE